MAHRILIIEDEFMVAAMVQSALRRANYDVVGICDNCADSVDALNDGGIDAVTLDLSLSAGESSLPIAKMLEARCIPYVIVTGFDAAAFAEKEGLRPAGLLGKPFLIRELIDAIACCFAISESG